MHLTGLARVARSAGITVREVPGWQTRSAHKGGMNKVCGVIWHHTATPASAVVGRNNPTLNYMVNGLGYPLANYGLAWDGSLDVISAGTGAHAGKGSYRGVPNNDGNRHMIGIEVEGTIGLAWSPAQLETAARLGAALDREFGTKLLHIGHYEWAPGRKTDPSGIPGHMPSLRAAIARGYWDAPTLTVQNASTVTTTTPEPAKDWLDMATEADVRKIIKEETEALYARLLAGIQWAEVGYNGDSLKKVLHEARTGAQQGYQRIVGVDSGQAALTAAIAQATANGVTPEQITAIAEQAREGAKQGVGEAIREGLTEDYALEVTATVKSKEN